jgi:Bacterial mobilisation protein (MobC)
MNGGAHLSSWVSHDTKQHFAAIARHQGLSESALLKRLIDLMFRTAAGDGGAIIPTEVNRVGRDARLTVRLRADDQLLLRERASARGMAAATYVSVLVRSHLRGLTRLTQEERLALKECVAELAAIGRNLNQIARASNQGGRLAGPAREDLRAILKACEALRGHVRGVLKANAVSWQVGHGAAHD